MSHAPNLVPLDYVAPIVAAVVFIALVSLIREPARRNFSVVFVAGAGGVYFSGGFGLWELLLPVIMGLFAYGGLRSYRLIGVAWLVHAGWDVAHHLYGNPIWPFMPTSSFGCLLFDAVIAIWFLAGAPSLVSLRSVAKSPKLAGF